MQNASAFPLSKSSVDVGKRGWYDGLFPEGTIVARAMKIEAQLNDQEYDAAAAACDVFELATRTATRTNSHSQGYI